MKGLLKEALHITNNSIILTIPLILFVKILDLYSMYSKYQVDTPVKLVIASATLICMFCVFASGWFYMVKEAINLSKKVFILDKDRAKATLNLFKSVLEGVGKYFMPFLGATLIYIFVIQLIASQIVWVAGNYIIGSLDKNSMKVLQEISISTAASNGDMSLMLDKMTPEMLIFFAKWSILFIIVTFIFTYLLMLWLPEIIYKETNPIIALGTSINKLFKDFFNTSVLFISLWSIGFLILFVNTFSIMINPYIYLIMSILMFYFFVYISVTIFLYYNKKYVTENDEE